MNNNTAETAVAKRSAIKISGGDVELTDLDEVKEYSMLIHTSALALKGDTPQTIAVKILSGLQLGMSPLASIQNIAVINGRACLWGDAVPGVCNASGKCEAYFHEEIGKEGTDSYGYRATAKRIGIKMPFVAEFTIADAKQAGLWGGNVWAKYPKRMLLNRARTYVLRDAFPDVLKGMISKDEAKEIAVEADFHVVENEPEPEPFQNNDPGIVFTPEDDTNLPPEPIVDTDTGEVTEEDGEKETNMFGGL